DAGGADGQALQAPGLGRRRRKTAARRRTLQARHVELVRLPDIATENEPLRLLAHEGLVTIEREGKLGDEGYGTAVQQPLERLAGEEVQVRSRDVQQVAIQARKQGERSLGAERGRGYTNPQAGQKPATPRQFSVSRRMRHSVNNSCPP